ncbi:MAG: S41 family peptidase [Bacteroidota bacterium]
MGKRYLLLLSVGLLLVFGFVSDTSDRYFEISKNMEIFGKVYTDINLQYADPTSPTQLMRTGVDAMLKTLDPYTVYYGESQIEYSKLIQSGQYSGIGCDITESGDRIILVNFEDGGPADEAGLRVGDMLETIDNESVTRGDRSLDQIRTLLFGERETEVKLTIKRGGELKEIIVIRGGKQGAQEDVPYFAMANDSIGYILQVGFSGRAAQSVKDAFNALKKEHELKGLILDLRANPGGRLDQAVDICNHFIPSGKLIVEMRGRTKETQNKFYTRNSPLDTQIPVAVLVNGRSASASEIVAGAIQDLDRGVIVGVRSFGKGLVQNFRPLSYNTQMKITVAKYYTPSGRCIQSIDYFNDEPGAGISKVPDSLISAFKTQNGRVVYDGGGIDPDVTVEKPKEAPVTKALKEQKLIFDFATDFQAKNDSILPPREFDVSDALFQQFIAFVEEKGFSFSTETEKKLESLQGEWTADKMSKADKALFDKMRNTLAQQKKNDLTRHKDQIAPLIRKEIIERYHFNDGIIESNFVHDSDILRAIDIISNKKYYSDILAGRK